jgi:hypothetical protein
MNDIYILVVIFIVVAIVVFFIAVAVDDYLTKQLKTVFVIKIKYRDVKLVKGSAPNRFITECNEVAKIRKTIQGKVFGIQENSGIKLEFSKSISEAEKQIFRNVWPDAYLGGNPPPESGTRKRAKRF